MIPNKAWYIAQNEDGWWYWYKRKPTLCKYLGQWERIDCTICAAITNKAPPKDFTQELYELVDEEELRYD